MSFVTELLDKLSPAQANEIDQLANSVTVFDDLAPLSEHVLLQAHHSGVAGDRHLLVHTGGVLVGYAHIDEVDQLDGAVVEIMVHPRWRRMGIGSQLIEAAKELVAPAPLRLWAHGEFNSAYALASKYGFDKSRELWQMRRSLLAPIPKFETPTEVSIRAFVTGVDNEAWLALNAEVFSEHPEQGSWSAHQLEVRLAEPWFDPAGFLVAEQTGKLVGFHWTKIHRREDGSRPDVGEIYILGVAPNSRGTGLSKSLAVAGLTHLRSMGLGTVTLYVDADNSSAIRLYEELGFMHWDTDVMFTHANN